ncbi:nucleoside-diphosphate-sugar epimerase [Dysgonomonas sp. PFB1-18]|uniref:NAD-dependent epimerase/dehydratase family protein n=1 Tax=unclassified Dysgonomonas TaxID=2630389 RepID=UPI0024738E22|nr:MULTISPECIES: NAD(P)-dependent oxidoreductase [unclassified Dysgonomonas]MDH6307660.1 nucleoside-diphosphate-sugar epimerase [Dysgonomonas sp. PF1-14]MDH6337578.1 nucleoside-diphosphate-sugar epimerase [Dysgonomonas sp. PF1-16]MDH6378802.1 nucleoside-diphosphate-sugar epimerase [Dysgonomonas sp. PFB1-18]MDH6396437.1 nucleoside-diphosphate-sugar epimerase [Dysgonomonas sp. PF1-23]
MTRIAITGAAGNLGGLLAQGMKDMDVNLNLLIHNNDVPDDLKQRENVSVFRTDLAKKETLSDALRGVDVIVHFAGILFKANPEKFLPITNTQYFKNLLTVAVRQKVKRVILISFPHVEGECTSENPAKGVLSGNPESAHARTRLEEEKLLFQYGDKHGFEAVSLRVGMVYGQGILMIDAGQWFARHWLLGVWKKPTEIHLISKPDFVDATIAAALKPDVRGIYHVGDEGVQTLQEFLDDITVYKGNHKPWRMPVWMIMTAARGFELFSALFGTRSPLTRDFVKIGMVSYYGDTSRMRQELLPELKYKTYKEGIDLF